MRNYHVPIIQATKNDIKTLLDNDPESFEAVLYKTNLDVVETLTDTPDTVGTIEYTERQLEYSDPILTKIKIIPPEWAGTGILTTDDPSWGGVNEDELENIQILIREDNVPKFSVIQYDEMQDDGNVREVTLYVKESHAFGQPPVGIKYIMKVLHSPGAAFGKVE